MLAIQRGNTGCEAAPASATGAKEEGQLRSYVRGWKKETQKEEKPPTFHTRTVTLHLQLSCLRLQLSCLHLQLSCLHLPALVWSSCIGYVCPRSCIRHRQLSYLRLPNPVFHARILIPCIRHISDAYPNPVYPTRTLPRTLIPRILHVSPHIVFPLYIGEGEEGLRAVFSQNK